MGRKQTIRTKRTGFSLVELVIVIVIIGVIAAIAIPRVSQASRGAGESALSSNLAVLRNAIELYASEHGGQYPASTDAGGSYGTKETPECFVAQLTMYSNASGTVSPTKDPAQFPFGPYLRKEVPPAPVGDNKGKNGVKIDKVNSPPQVVSDTTTGWVYNPLTGDIIVNSDQPNEAGTKDYNQY
ncbi:MAG: prepilin-type N-terminal cleavage/methylation domain-containing protein [Phycisphaerae bacterium]